MTNVRASHLMLGVGGFLLAMSPLIMSREGMLLFAGVGAILVITGLYALAQKR